MQLGLDVVALVGEIQAAPHRGEERRSSPTSTTPAMITPEIDRQLVGDAGDAVSIRESSVGRFAAGRTSREGPSPTRKSLWRVDVPAIAYHAIASTASNAPAGSLMTDTTSVKLRAVELDDLPFTRQCRNDPSIHVPALGRRFPITEAGEEAWFRSLGQGSPPARGHVHRRRVRRRRRRSGLTTLRDIDWINRHARCSASGSHRSTRPAASGTSATRADDRRRVRPFEPAQARARRARVERAATGDVPRPRVLARRGGSSTRCSSTAPYDDVIRMAPLHSRRRLRDEPDALQVGVDVRAPASPRSRP